MASSRTDSASATPTTAAMFDEMQQEETTHHSRLLDMFRQRFGQHVPLIRRQDVKASSSGARCGGSVRSASTSCAARPQTMELETRRFYERAMERISDVSIRQLLGELAATEREHYARATTLEKELLTPETRQAEDEAARRLRPPSSGVR